MLKFLIPLFIPLLLFGNFKFNDNYEKQVKILRKFDVESSFLNDKLLIKLFHEYQSEAK